MKSSPAGLPEACFFYTNIHSGLICSVVLVGLDESCPTYIISELHWYFSLKRRGKKKPIPLSYLCISPARSQSLPDLLSSSHPLLPHISHLLLLYSGRPIRRRVSVCVTNPLRNFTSLLLDRRLNLHYSLKRYFIYN